MVDAQHNLDPEKLELVNRICEKIAAEGEKPSARLVVKHSGGVIKSTSTAIRYLGDWTSKQKAKKKELKDNFAFSDEMVDAFVSEITLKVRSESKALEEENETLKRLTKEANEALEEEEEKTERLSRELEAASQSIQQLNDDKIQISSSAKATEESLRDQIEVLTSKLEQANLSNENIRGELAKSQLTLESNNELVQQYKDSNAELQQANREAQQAIIELEKEVATLTEKNTGVLALVEEKSATNKQLLASLEQRNETVKSQEQTISKLNDTLVSQSSQLEQAQHNVSAVNNVLESRVTELDAEKRLTSELTDQKAELRGKNEELNKVVGQQREELITADNKQQELSNEVSKSKSSIQELSEELENVKKKLAESTKKKT